MGRELLLVSPFFLGVTITGNILNDLIPDVDFDNEDCLGDVCFPRHQVLLIDNTKTDSTNKLNYHRRSIGYAKTTNLINACLPGVKKETVGSSFTSCKKKMEDVCTFAKRGWLIKDSQNETVPNLDLLQKAFSGIEGGDEAVKTCLEVKEEIPDDYWYYDYDYYYDDAYDYLEEGNIMEARKKREAGDENKKRKKTKNKKRKKGKKSKKADKAKKGKKKKKKNGRQGKANKGKKGKKEKKGSNKNRKNGRKGKAKKAQKGNKRGKERKKGRKNGNKDKKRKDKKKKKNGKKGKDKKGRKEDNKKTKKPKKNKDE